MAAVEGGSYAKRTLRHMKTIVSGYPHTPKRLAMMFFMRRTLLETQENNQKVSKGDMIRTLGWFDFMCMGVGSIVATGIFSFTGYIYSQITGPGVVFAFLIAGAAAALSAICYSEFAVELPIAGGGFAYCLFILGEFIAWLAVVNLLFEYVLSNAALARGFSAYFAQLIGKNSDIFQHQTSWSLIDWMACLLSIVLMFALAASTKFASEGNIGLQILHFGLLFMVIIAGYTKANTANWTPLFPFGAKSVATGAGQVFFVFIGYDAIALGAEEAKKPRDVPTGMLGSIGVVMVIYMLMVTVLVMLIPFPVLAAQPGEAYVSAYAYAFEYAGLTWMKYIVALGACVGIFTSLGVGIFSMARAVTAMARERMVPPIFGWVWERTGTPVIATLTMGTITAIIALLTSFNVLANLVSLATLFVYYLVAIAFMWRRYWPNTYPPEACGDRALGLKTAFPITHEPTRKVVFFVLGFLATTAAPIGFVVYFDEVSGYIWLVITAVVWFVCSLGIQLTIPIQYVPADWAVPAWLLPWIPTGSCFFNLFLIGSLTKEDFIRFAVLTGAAIAIYLLYGVHASYMRFYGPEANQGMHGEGAPVDIMHVKDSDDYKLPVS